MNRPLASYGTLPLVFTALCAFALAACSAQEELEPPVATLAEPISATPAVSAAPASGFQGKIAISYDESEEWWPEPETAPEGAPNVIIFQLDDVGFAQVQGFGGLIETPNIDKLAANGLRFNNFHTTALCSPSRASLMAGRNPHSIGLGSHALTAMGFPGYNAIVPDSAKSVANYLQEAGYINYALGKWDHTPLYEVSQVGPFERWPSGEGFDHAYTFMAADVHQFVPVMWNDHSPERHRKSVHLDKDLADRAIDWISGHKSIKPDEPFMMLWASGSMHSPHHAPDEYLKKYRGKFDMGWDEAREVILAKQKKLGIVPPDTNLTERIDEIPAWDSLNAEEKQLYARQMEAFAAQMDHVDFQIGRIVDTLERIGELDNTLIFVTADNGASGEGGLAGTFNETYVLNGSSRASTAAGSTTRWWCTGLTGSRRRARCEASTTTSATSRRPSWRRRACLCPTATTASSSSRWTASRCATPSTMPMLPTASSGSITRCSAIARSGPTAGRRSRCMPTACRGSSTSSCHSSGTNGSCTT
jgi:arylsulfatase